MELLKAIYFFEFSSMMNIQNLGSGDRYIYPSFALEINTSLERLNSEENSLK